MERNIGNVDRVVRVVLGIVMLGMWFVLDEDIRNWMLLGLEPLVTGFVGWSPVYRLLNINTCRLDLH